MTAETIQRRKLFKGGNYMRKYGIHKAVSFQFFFINSWFFFSISITFQFLEAEKPNEEASRKQHEALKISMNAQEQLSPEEFEQFCRICCNDSLSNKRKFMELHTLVTGKMDLQVKPNLNTQFCILKGAFGGTGFLFLGLLGSRTST